METIAYSILRIGLASTFLITGIFILISEDKWVHMIQPWAEKFIIGGKRNAMITTAFFDLFLGLWLFSGLFTWIAALLAALHLIQVLITAGITHETYRDIGLLTASITLLLISIPADFVNNIGLF